MMPAPSELADRGCVPEVGDHTPRRLQRVTARVPAERRDAAPVFCDQFLRARAPAPAPQQSGHVVRVHADILLSGKHLRNPPRERWGGSQE